MLMPSPDRVPNMRAATPEWLRMPTPTMEILATRSSATTPCRSDLAGERAQHALGARPVRAGRVNEMSVSPSRLMFCTIMSTTMFCLPSPPKTRRGDAGPVGHAQDRDLGLPAVVGDAGHHHVFHAVILPGHQRARVRLEGGAHVDRHVVLLGELDRAGLQHLGPQRGHLEHLVVGDAGQLARVGHHVGIGGVDAVHVGEDLAHVGLERGGERDAGEVGAAAAEGRDVPALGGALEAGHHRDAARVERGVDALGADALDAGAGVRAVGDEADLRAR